MSLDSFVTHVLDSYTPGGGAPLTRSSLRFSPGWALANSLRSNRDRLTPSPAAMLGAVYGDPGRHPKSCSTTALSMCHFERQREIFSKLQTLLYGFARFLPSIEMTGKKAFNALGSRRYRPGSRWCSRAPFLFAHFLWASKEKGSACGADCRPKFKRPRRGHLFTLRQR